jgi:hypothetical protein
MAKVTFTIDSDASLQTVFVLPVASPDEGAFVKLKSKDGKRTGKVDLEQGKHHYLLRLEGGAPEADWTLVVQREGRQPIDREGALDDEGNGGEVGQLTIFQ